MFATGSTPPSPSARPSAAETAHRVEVLGTLRSFVAQLLLVLQLWLWPIDGLPAVAAVDGPIPTISVIAVDGAVLACVNVVFPGSDTGVPEKGVSPPPPAAPPPPPLPPLPEDVTFA